ncbi:MAG TPA: alkaline phosphatase family protein [Blastocatellia bacterium]|nr:alkaline phosphatase family protein [Blastocatellia bacterium]
MKFITASLGLICLLTIAAQAQTPEPAPTPTMFQHVVIIFQENRTPDNLFQGLCAPPFGSSASCSPTLTPGKYDILTNNWLTLNGATIKPKPVALANTYDLDHSHTAFNEMCDKDTNGMCRMDGASEVHCGPNKGTTCPSNPQFRFVANTTSGLLNPYLELATQYGWANAMFQTNQGPSFPAHQFMFGGTSAPTTGDDAAGVYAAENMSSTDGTKKGLAAGCIALSTTRVKLVMPDGSENTEIYPCFEHQTMGDLLNAGPVGPAPAPVSWFYYAPSAGSIWTAPDAIDHICKSTGPGGKCIGNEWVDHVDVPGNKPTDNGSVDILRDIKACNLQQVSWVIPSCQNSDHASCNAGGGPSWVASIVNAIGQSSCASGNWKDTAIIITWDDWGGWYDHEGPTFLQAPLGGYQYGFRVPLIFVSAYTAPGYINNNQHDFGSVLRFIEHNFNLPDKGLGFADARTDTNLTGFYDFSRPARDFQKVSALKKASFFLHDKRKQLDPDDDDDH